MANILISAPFGTTGYTINAPTASTIGAYLSDPVNARLAVSVPTQATGRVFSSVGRTTGVGTTWRLRNGVGQSPITDATLSAYKVTDPIGQYFLPSGTDTFVTSPIISGPSTHILSFSGFSSTKAAGNQAVGSLYTIQPTDTFELRGAGGDDILNGGDRIDTLIGNGGNDTLTGNAGNDILTGGDGIDRFVFNNQGIDTVTEFTTGASGDKFVLDLGSYTGFFPDPDPGIGIGTVDDLIADPANDRSNFIVVDTKARIDTLLTGGVNENIDQTNIFFAYDTTNNQLLASSQVGGFQSLPDLIANVNSINGAPLVVNNFVVI